MRFENLAGLPNFCSPDKVYLNEKLVDLFVEDRLGQETIHSSFDCNVLNFLL